MTHLTKLALISTITSIFFVGCGEQGPTTSETPTESSVSSVLTTSQVVILDAINKARAEVRDCNDGRGLVGPSAPLTWNNDLYASAYEHSNDLSVSDTFSHVGSGTVSDVTGSNLGEASLFSERIQANGYSNYKIIGENIAGGQESIELAVEAWLASPAHCTNIMESDFKEVGVAVVSNPNSTYRVYWTQSFGGK